jgi:membrane-bound lytic murein transglycosylase
MNPNQPENNQDQKKEQQQVTPQPIVDKKEEKAPDIKTEENQENWKKFREQREKERKEREEAIKFAEQKQAEADALKAALEALTSNNRQINQNNPDDIEESEDVKINKRIDAIIKEREAEAEKKRQEMEKKEFPQRLRNIYPDFQKTISEENLDYLEYHYPEVAKPLQRLPDDFDKWSDIYKAVKKFVPNIDSKKDAAKVDKNLNKPNSISSPGANQGSNTMPSFVLDDAKKAANWARMERTMKGIG